MSILKTEPSKLDQSLIRQLELMFALIGLIFYSGALVVLLDIINLGRVATLIRYGLMLLSIIGLSSNWQKTSYALKEAKWLWPLTLCSIASFLWSWNPAITIQSLRSDLIPMTLFAVYLAVRFSRPTLFLLIHNAVLIISITSLFFGFFIPSIGRHPMDHAYPGAWKGIFVHKNGLGLNLILTNIFLSLKFLDRQQKKNIIDFFLIFLLIFGTIASESLSALLISCITIALIWLYCTQYRWKGNLTIFMAQIVFIVAIPSIAALIIFWNPLLTALGKDPTMSARTLIWEYVLDKVGSSPLLGFGRSVFWKIPALFQGVWDVAGHVPAHAHNGYIDLLAELGYLGLFLFFIALLPVIWKVLKLAYQNTNMYDIWPFAFIIVFMIGNWIESLLIRDSNYFWLIFIILSCLKLKKNDFY